MAATVLDNRYEIVSRLGRGGMGQVFQARDRRLLRDVAVKILEHISSEEALFLFHREARAAAKMQHPGIVQIFDYSGPEQRPPYLVMELLDGQNLAETLAPRFPLDEIAIMAIVARLAAALAHAHRCEVVHRDIKPTNVMFGTSARIVLSDFGLAKSFRDPESLGKTMADRLTRLHGSADFLSPEQVIRMESSPASDMFSFGSLVYWLCTGRSPFMDRTPMACMRKVAELDRVALHEARPGLDRAVLELVAACHAMQPEERPRAADVAGRARGWLHAKGGWEIDDFLEALLPDGRRSTDLDGAPPLPATDVRQLAALPSTEVSVVKPGGGRSRSSSDGRAPTDRVEVEVTASRRRPRRRRAWLRVLVAMGVGVATGWALWGR